MLISPEVVLVTIIDPALVTNGREGFAPAMPEAAVNVRSPEPMVTAVPAELSKTIAPAPDESASAIRNTLPELAEKSMLPESTRNSPSSSKSKSKTSTKIMSPSAFKVRSSLSTDPVIVVRIVMSPASEASPAEPVWITTFPESRAASRTSTSSTAPSPLVVNGSASLPSPVMFVLGNSGTGTSTIVILFGSSSRVPLAPLGAVRSTLPVNARLSLPETSTKPPSPLSAPPRAVIVPPKRVPWSAQTMTVPPSPWVIASASIRMPLER